jgi:23S rRNA pseudouridine1911/1915/1917 synthase
MIITDDRVLYIDNHLIAINKLPGEIVQGDKTGDTPLSEHVKSYLKEKFNKPGKVFLGTIHRIDRPVSGVVLFARTSKGLARMNDLFKQRNIEKVYIAATHKKDVPKKGTLKNWLTRNESRNRSTAHGSETEGSSLAELSYEVIGATDNYMIFMIWPRTGRHHQIRVQLSAIGCSIKGDVKYGARRGNNDGSIHLHAYKLIFEHPVKGTPIEISATPPKEPVWDQAIEFL